MDPIPSVICTVDVVLLTLQQDSLHAALLLRERKPYAGQLALPGGYVHTEQDADTQDAALRVLREKTGIIPPYLEQLATFSGPARDPRGWSVSVAYTALAPLHTLQAGGLGGPKSGAVRLIDVNHLPALPFDHAHIIAAARERVRLKSQYSSLPCHFAGEQFTLPKLQKIYESLLGEPLNKVSFRRKIQEMDMLEEVPGVQEATGAHRPAQVYRLKAAYRDAISRLERGL
ncbi:NUDIX domain-containing protein [Massilia sp. W12]|uniref:NUDIX hydrolase n=1 Tax=Massilia sp. W12 TaxID=3126507 RepID=UPI0030D2460D